MSESNWDNGGAPPKRKGLHPALWVLLGCGILVLLVLGGCASCLGCGYYKFKGMQKQMHASYSAVVTQLGTDEGCKALYAANPGLAQRWATEADFLKTAAGWRKDLGTVPVEPPGIKEMQQEIEKAIREEKAREQRGAQEDSKGQPAEASREADKHQGGPMEFQYDNGHKRAVYSLRTSTGKRVRVIWENDRVADIQVR